MVVGCCKHGCGGLVESMWRLGILAWVLMVWLGFWLVLCFNGMDWQLVLLVDFGVSMVA